MDYLKEKSALSKSELFVEIDKKRKELDSEKVKLLTEEAEKAE